MLGADLCRALATLLRLGNACLRRSRFAKPTMRRRRWSFGTRLLVSFDGEPFSPMTGGTLPPTRKLQSESAPTYRCRRRRSRTYGLAASIIVLVLKAAGWTDETHYRIR